MRSLIGKISRAVTCAAVIASAGTLFGVTVEWISGATSLADGAVSIEYDGETITRFTANVTGDEKLTITGTDAVPFAANAQIVISNGTVRFEAPITGAGALAVNSAFGQVVWDAIESGNNDYLPESEKDAVVVATGVKLDDFTVEKGTAGVDGLGYHIGSGENKVQPYCFVRGEGTLSCQMQHFSDHWIKCTYLNLKQDGEDIVAWTPDSYYRDYNTGARCGDDFRVGANFHMGVCSVAKKKGGYGLDGLTLVATKTVASVEVAAGVSISGTLTVGDGLLFVADGPTALAAADTSWNVPLYIYGTFRMLDPYGVKMGGLVRYGTKGRYEAKVTKTMPSEAMIIDAPKLPSGSWTTFATNLCVAGITNVTAVSGGGGYFDPVGGTLSRGWLENDGKVMTVQLAFPHNGWYVKGVVYQIRQYGPYLQHRILRSAATAEVIDISKLDLRTQGFSMDIYSGTGNGYGLADIKVYFKSGASQCSMTLANGLYREPKGYSYFEGRADSPLSIMCEGAEASLPENLEVGPNASFYWDGKGGQGSAGTTVTVDEGGEFSVVSSWTWNTGVAADLNGGVFRIQPNRTTTDACDVYLEYLNFINGGHLAENITRCGYYENALWTVRGTKPAYIDKGIGLVGNGEGTGSPFNRSICLDVNDVTDSDDPDLYVNGNIYYSNSQWKMAHVVKTGPGKVQHNGVMSANTYPMIISNGVWQVTRSNGIVAGCGLELSGGTLELDAKCTLSLGTLLVGANSSSAVDLGAESTITFSGITEGEGGIVDFRCADSRNAIRIGTGETLTAAQRRCLRINGRRIHQDENGYLVEGTSGLQLIIQ